MKHQTNLCRSFPRSQVGALMAGLALVLTVSCGTEDETDPSITGASAAITLGSVNVLTRNYDNGRSGANTQETVLKASNVNAASFGKRFSVAVDNPVFAGILYASQVPMAGGNKDVFYVATMNNTVYAFDANVGGSPLWQKNFNAGLQPTRTNQVGGGPPFFCNPYVDISGNGSVANIGIVGTPVIDAASGKYYVVTRTGSGTPGTVQKLHALDILTGNETAGSPVTLSAAGFSAELNNQRPALALANGRVYISFSSFCDAGSYHGIVLGYSVSNLGAAPQVYNVTPSGSQGGIWMGGAGPVVDSSGSVYVATGNGTSDTTNLGEALVKLSPSSLSTVQDWFMPSNFASLNGSDTDLGSGGPTLLPGVANRIVQGSKEGKVYLLDTTNLGHVRTDGANPQTLNAVIISNGGSTKHIHNASVAWQSQAGLNLYVWGENDALRAFRWNGSTFNGSAFAVGSKVLPKGMPGGMMTLSSSGSTPGTGILWAFTPAPTSGADNGQNDANHNLVPGILRAFNAESLALLWESTSGSDNTGTFAKFNPPIVANGRVYVPSFANTVSVYGLAQASTPFVTVNLPGTIEAENYDNGGEGVAYHDSDVANQGNTATPPNTFRTTEAVDLQPTGDTGGGFNLGWTAVGEWLKYTVNVTQAGLYTLTGRYASNAGAGSFRVEVDGADATGTIQPATTNSWTTWNTFTKTNVNLPAGQHVLRLFIVTAGFNLNKLTFTAQGGPALPTLPGTIQAEAFDEGGEGVAYHDTDTINQGDVTTRAGSSPGVDIQTTADTGGGANIGWIGTNEWLRYTVNVTAAGTYTVTFRVASGLAATTLTGQRGQLRMEVDGVNVTGDKEVVPTGNWQAWSDLSVPGIAFSGGMHTVRIFFSRTGLNFNFFRVQ